MSDNLVGKSIIESTLFTIKDKHGAYCIKLLPLDKNRVKSENSGKHNFTIDFAIGKKTSGKSFMQYRDAVKVQTSLAPLSWFPGSRVTTAHAHQCCRFQSYAKTVPSRMKLTMKLTMREPTWDPWHRTRDHGVCRLTLTVYRPQVFLSSTKWEMIIDWIQDII